MFQGCGNCLTRFTIGLGVDREMVGVDLLIRAASPIQPWWCGSAPTQLPVMAVPAGAKWQPEISPNRAVVWGLGVRLPQANVLLPCIGETAGPRFR